MHRILAAVTVLALTPIAHADHEPVVFSGSITRLGVGERFDDALAKSGLADLNGVIDTIGTGLTFLITQTGLSFVLQMHFGMSSPRAGREGEELGSRCLQAYPTDRWMQLSCLSENIFLTVRRYGVEPQSKPCQSITHALQRGFDVLNIPHARADISGTFGGHEGHIFGRLAFVDPNGDVYAYALDAMLAPQAVFPLTLPTEHFHLRHGRQQLPEFATK